ncbi:MAG: glycosyltransferase family 39 protein, partial [Bdellovibrionaceae bacterium]|nr:glycosyltransferase family 39 protein [Pseudobdellovibrionaceae bacterium]
MRGEWTISYKGALFIFLHILALRALFSLTTGLIDDEAYHWSWTKDLMLSYYDHPGFVAWMGKLSTALFGDSLLGVRAFSFLFYSASIVIAWRLARDLFGDWSAHFTAFMLLFTPLWGLGGYVYSPEPFFVFFWVSAAWVFWQGVRPDPDRWSPQKTWLWLGILMGLGLNSKFIMALLAPGFGLFLLTQRQYRCHLLSRWPWIGVLISILICLPIFLWNIDFDWPGFKYQFHDRHTDAAPSFNRWLQFLSAQVLFMTPVLFALMVAAVVRALKRWEQPHWRFIT